MRSIRNAAAWTVGALLLLANPVIAQTANDTLAKVKETKTLTIGYRESSVPFSFLDAQQKPIGFSLDLCMAVVEVVKQKVGVADLKLAYTPVNSSNRIPLVKNGTVDLECGSTANNMTRQKEVAFSVATFISQTRWLVKTNAGMKAAADLKGKTIVVTQGSNAVGFARKINDEAKLDLKTQQAKDHAESFLMLETDRAAAFLEDDILVAGMKAASKSPTDYTMLPDVYEMIPYGLMFRRDDPQVKALVDEVLSGLMKSGAYDTIYAKWFESPIPPNNINLQFSQTAALKERVKTPSDKVDN